MVFIKADMLVLLFLLLGHVCLLQKAPLERVYDLEMGVITIM